MDLRQGILSELLSSQQPVVVSNVRDGQVLGMNTMARERFGDAEKVPELFGLRGAAAQSYTELDYDTHAFDFMNVELHDMGEVVLDSVIIREGGESLRVDSICPRGYGNHVDCLNKYELASRQQLWTSALGDVSETVSMLLRAAMFVYAADRSFIFEVDPDLECVVDIYSESRTGFSDEIANIRKTDEFGVRTMLDA